MSAAIIQGLLTVLQVLGQALLALGQGLWALVRTCPAAVVFGVLAGLFGYTLVTTPPFSYLLNSRVILLLLLVGLGLGLWLDWRR
jgi:hypothetical protein